MNSMICLVKPNRVLAALHSVSHARPPYFMTIPLRCLGNTAYLFFQYFNVASNFDCIPTTLSSNLTTLTNEVSVCLRQAGVVESSVLKRSNDLLVCVFFFKKIFLVL